MPQPTTSKKKKTKQNVHLFPAPGFTMQCTDQCSLIPVKPAPLSFSSNHFLQKSSLSPAQTSSQTEVDYLKQYLSDEYYDIYFSMKEAFKKGFLYSFICTSLEEILKTNNWDARFIQGITQSLRVLFALYDGASVLKALYPPIVQWMLTSKCGVSEKYATPFVFGTAIAFDVYTNPIPAMLSISSAIGASFFGSKVAKFLHEKVVEKLYASSSKKNNM